ncbi:MAG TPA: hypothetical protein VF409_03170 [Sphingomonas sp.]
MTGILITIFVVVLLHQVNRVRTARRAIAPRFDPVPLADQRSAPPGWFAAEPEAEPDGAAAEPAIAIPVPRARSARPTRYLLDAGPAAGDRTRAMMDMFAAPGICTPRRRPTR